MAIFLRFGIFRKIENKKQSGKDTRVEGAPYPPGRAPSLVGTLCALWTPFSCTILLLVGKKSLYNLPKVLTTVSHKYLMFFFELFSAKVVKAKHHVVSLLLQ